jgi:8-oxo-dGTP pyrophosphatase MutT (NUDIX family)
LGDIIMPQVQVLVLLVRDGGLYLAEKKLKIGQGRLNAPGGKMELEDEGDPKKTAVRELYQESGAVVRIEDLKLVALLHITREGKGHEIDLYVYMTEIFTGDFIETSEMGMLKSYRFCDIDYGLMMPADGRWLPAVLFPLTVEVNFTYNRDRTEVLSFEMRDASFD